SRVRCGDGRRTRRSRAPPGTAQARACEPRKSIRGERRYGISCHFNQASAFGGERRSIRVMAPADLVESIETARRLLEDARAVTVLTGAGISTDSGIPDF